ncbi:MAG: hypothetical protein VB137_09945 [Burkholderia sp.]
MPPDRKIVSKQPDPVQERAVDPQPPAPAMLGWLDLDIGGVTRGRGLEDLVDQRDHRRGADLGRESGRRRQGEEAVPGAARK